MSYCNRFRAVAKQSLRQGQRFTRFRPVLTSTVNLRQFSDPFSVSSPVLKPNFPIRTVATQVPTQATAAGGASTDASTEEGEEEGNGKSPSGTGKKGSSGEEPDRDSQEHDPGPGDKDEYVEFAEEPGAQKDQNEQKQEETPDKGDSVDEPPKQKRQKMGLWGSFKKTMSNKFAGDQDDDRAEELEAKIQVLEAHNMKLKQMGVNLQDDMERLRKRTEKEKEEISKFAVTKFAKEMLIVQDNFQLAMQNMSPECCEKIAEHPEIQAIIDGVKMTQKTLDQTFNKFDIKQIPSKGEIADYNYHEVMFTTPDSEKENLEIVQVLREGYLIGDRVLRNAQVGVVKNN